MAEGQPAVAGSAARAAIPAKVLAVVVPVIVAGAATFAYALYAYVGSSPSATDVAQLLGLFASMVVAERFPVPLEGVSAGGMTLGFVFSVSAIILLGWPAGAIIAAGAPTLTHLVQRRPPLRAAYNGSMFALSALAAGLVVERMPGHTIPQLVAQVVVCGVIYYWVVNLVLISAVLAASTGRSFFEIARENITQTAAPFAFMVSSALALVVLWQREPWLSIALVGPLLAIALYQRSTFKAMQAMRLALTDPLTGLGNRKYFDRMIEMAVQSSLASGEPLSLLMFDIDHFKAFNDSFGHLTGDQVLRLVALSVRHAIKGQDITARYGGDEFAVLLPDTALRQALIVADHIRRGVMAKELRKKSTGEILGRVTISIGVAMLKQGDDTDALIERADACLYAAKRNGRNRVISERDPEYAEDARSQMA